MILLNATYALDASTASVDAEPTSIPFAKTMEAPPPPPPLMLAALDDEEEYTAREMEIVPSESTASAVAVSWCIFVVVALCVSLLLSLFLSLRCDNWIP